jgi:putative FmdB family regulatory protein
MTYEYVCGACGHQWEAEQSIKDRPLEECVSCGAKKAKRLISGGTGFLLKGGGWYADLYGSPGSGKASDEKNKAGTAAAKSEGADAKGSGESKSTGDGKAAASSGTSSASSSSDSSSSGSSSSGSSSPAPTPSAKAS